ncbi:MAG: tRNA (guanosine(46)-N7)-methyltransferase TrmB [Nitratiruptor sp.]|nr:tRNA (guanosine(46)-N7)-methyltransferase TrmB [Nitratiruptor sp.]NPA84173.1 tRNA (guanosine(46)-N7)-methyltransferase TrmB [Campylobacterota bacterium]
MPHIVARSYTPFPTPARVGELTFLWFADPLKGASNRLVGVQYRQDPPFLLEMKSKGDRFVIKSVKATRISPTYRIKEALQAFCHLAQCDILSHNLSSLKPGHAIKAESYFKEIDYFVHNFPKEREVWIEIGFGSGRHLLSQAKANPYIQFIGIEIHKPSIEQLLKQIALQGLTNILVVDYDARLFLEFVPSNLVGRIFLHFPVPWEKKPHRRVMSPTFVDEVHRVLKVGGRLELRTDSLDYLRYSLDLLLQRPFVDFQVSKNREALVASKYEERWRRLGRDIYDLHLLCHEIAPPRRIEADFSFDLVSCEKIVEKFDNRAKVYDGYFLHLQRLYQIEGGGLLLELSFGSFDRPEHRYIKIEADGRASYFPTPPIPSQANLQAHKRIREWLHE